MFFGQASDEIERAESLRGQGRYLEAIDAYKSAQAHHGKPSRVLENHIGLTYQFAGQHETAILHFTNAIAIEESAANLVNRGTSYHNIGRCDLAINDAQTALAIQPEHGTGYHTHAEAHEILAICHLEQGNFDTALTHLHSAISIARQHEYRPSRIADFHYFTAIAYTRQNRIPEATEAYTKSIDTSDNPDARINRAWLYQSQNDCQPATHDAQVALTMEPSTDAGYHSYAEAHRIFAWCFVASNHLIQSQTHAQQALSLMSTSAYDPNIIAQMHIYDANAHAEVGQTSQATHAYNNAVAASDTAHTRIIRADFLYDINQCPPAISDAKVALRQEPTNQPGYHTSVEAQVIIGLCAEQNGDNKTAREQLQAAIHLMTTAGYTPEDIQLFQSFVSALPQ